MKRIFILIICFLAYINVNATNLALIQKGIACNEDRIDLIGSSEIVLGIDYPISSNIYLNGKSLKLKSNLFFLKDKFFKSNGTVNLGSHEIFLGRYSNTITSTVYWDGSKGSICLDGTLFLTSSWTFSGYCMIDGNNNILDLTNTGSLIIEKGSTLKLKNLRLSGLHGENINNLNDSCKVILENVTCDLTGDFDFNCGTCEIYSFVDLNGTYTFFYDSPLTITVHKNTICEISRGLTWAIRTKDSSGGNQPFWFEDKSSEIRIDSASLQVGPAGVNFTRGWMGVHGKIDLKLTNTTLDGALQIGNGNQDDDFEIVFYPASTVVVHSGAFVVDCINPYSIKSLSGFSKLHRLANNNFYIKKNFIMNNLSVYIQSPTEMLVDDGSVAAYQDCKFMFDGVKFATTSSRYSDSVLLLSGDNSIFIEEGNLPLYAMIASNGNKIHGSGSMQGKIIFSGSGSELTYGLDSEMINDIDLNGGTLILERDLIFSGGYGIRTAGIINLSCNDLIFNGHDLNITSTLYFDGDEGTINLNSTLFLTSQWTFSGNCVLNGNGNILDLSTTGSLIIERGSTLRFKNVHLIGLNNENINNLDDNCHVIFDNVICDLVGDFNFNCGSAEIYNFVDLNGTYTFFYDTKKTLTIHSNTVCEISKDLTFAIRTKDFSGGNKPFYFEDSTSKIGIKSAKIKTGSAGMLLTRGTITISGRADFEVNSTNTSNGLLIGDGSDDGNFHLVFNPASTLVISPGHYVIDSTNPKTIQSLYGYSKLHRLAGNILYFKKDVEMRNISVYLETPTEMIMESGVARYESCKFMADGIKFSTTSTRYLDSVLELGTGDSIFIEEGILPLYALVVGTGNKIHGTGSMLGQIMMSGPNSEVIVSLDGQLLNDVQLNYGKIILGQDLTFVTDKFFIGQGNVELADNCLTLGKKIQNIDSEIYFDSSGGSIALSNNVNLQAKWTFSGNSVLNGNGNILDLDGGKIVVEKASILYLKNLNLFGVNNHTLECLDDNTTLYLDNVKIIQDSDFTFSVGKLQIYNQVDIDSSFTFYYESKNTLTINKNSELNFLNKSTLAVGMLGNLETNEPIWWSDRSSILGLDNAKVRVGDSGFRVFRGAVVFSGKVNIDINSTTTKNGMILGNGVEDGDIDVIFNSASYVSFNSGALTYDLTKSDGIKSMSGYSKINRKPGQYLYIKKDLVFKNISISGSSGAVLDAEPGAAVIYDGCKMSFPGVIFKITGSRYSAYTSLLDGSDEIFLQEGVYPAYSLVKNSNNTISGNGSISGQILLFDSDSELNLNLDGQLIKNIIMNNGKLILKRDTEFSGNALIEGTGTVELNSHNLVFGSKDLNWTSTVYWDSHNSIIELNSMMKLSSSWTFSGNCILKGNKNILWLKPSAKIIVESGSTLELQNLRIKDLSGTKICCLDDSGQIIFNSCKALLNDNYIFDKGSFFVDYKFDLKGLYTFDYQSHKVSSIGDCSYLRLFPGTTFSYNPPVANRNLLNFSSDTSVFSLNNATLHSTATGMHLTRGRIEVIDNSYISNDATCFAEAMIMGDGTSKESNIIIDVLPGVTFNLSDGYLTYKNID